MANVPHIQLSLPKANHNDEPNWRIILFPIVMIMANNSVVPAVDHVDHVDCADHVDDVMMMVVTKHTSNSKYIVTCNGACTLMDAYTCKSINLQVHACLL